MHQQSALAQVVLEGVALPATKQELIDYARSQGAGDHVLRALDTIEDREYERIDEVGDSARLAGG